MLTVYFEDPHINARLVNGAVKHSLWGFNKRHEAAFRVYAAARQQQHAARARSAVAVPANCAPVPPQESCGPPEALSASAADVNIDETRAAASAAGPARQESDSEGEAAQHLSYAAMRAQLQSRDACAPGENKWRRRAAVATAFIAARLLAAA